MKISDLEKQLGYESLWEGYKEGDIADGYTSDLLSDVMGNAPDESVLITIQAHKNTVAVASLAGINAIVLSNNRPAPNEMIESAKEEGVALFRTHDNQFTASWKIHNFLSE
jgi:hypothetical protein